MKYSSLTKAQLVYLSGKQGTVKDIIEYLESKNPNGLTWETYKVLQRKCPKPNAKNFNVVKEIGNVRVMDVHVDFLRMPKNGEYEDLVEWNKNKSNLYVGRYTQAKGSFNSKWRNIFTSKNSKDPCGDYREHVLSTSLKDDLHELEGLTLGCWCVGTSDQCHALVLARLVKEFKQS